MTVLLYLVISWIAFMKAINIDENNKIWQVLTEILAFPFGYASVFNDSIFLTMLANGLLYGGVMVVAVYKGKLSFKDKKE